MISRQISPYFMHKLTDIMTYASVYKVCMLDKKTDEVFITQQECGKY